jgi:hypothetical protein
MAQSGPGYPVGFCQKQPSHFWDVWREIGIACLLGLRPQELGSAGPQACGYLFGPEWLCRFTFAVAQPPRLHFVHSRWVPSPQNTKISSEPPFSPSRASSASSCCSTALSKALALQ